MSTKQLEFGCGICYDDGNDKFVVPPKKLKSIGRIDRKYLKELIKNNEVYVVSVKDGKNPTKATKAKLADKEH